MQSSCFIISVESRATTPQDFERTDPQSNTEGEEKAVSQSVFAETKPIDKTRQEISGISIKTEEKQQTDVKKSVKLKEQEEPGTGTSAKIAPSDTKSEIPSQKSKLTGKIRTGWI